MLADLLQMTLSWLNGSGLMASVIVAVLPLPLRTLPCKEGSG